MKTLCLLLLFFYISANAADWYVRDGASGAATGLNWTDAWEDVDDIVWASVAAGDNVWLAGGSYTRLEPNKDGSSGSPVTFYRVRTTNSTPASATGWNAAYDATVTLNGIQAFNEVDWWTVDGQVPHSGIVVTNSDWTASIIQFSTAVANNITFRNLLIIGGATNQTMSGLGDVRGLNANFNGTGPATGLTVQYCTFSQMSSHIIALKWNDGLVENCIFKDNFAGDSGNHPNVGAFIGCTNWVWRFNLITNWLAEGLMFDFVGASDAPNDGWDIYANLWVNEYPAWNGRVMETQYRAQYRIRLFNNTVVDCQFGISNSGGGTWGDGCVSSNNIWFDVVALRDMDIGTDDYNLSDAAIDGANSITNATSGIFVNYAANDYRIVETVGASYPRGKGVFLGSPYNVAFDGASFANPPSIGAYEYQAAQGPRIWTITTLNAATVNAGGSQ